MSAIYAIYTSPFHAPIPDHLPTLVVTPHGQPSHVLYSYLHTDFNRTNYLLTPSPQGDLCVAKLFPPSRGGASSDGGHSRESKAVRCEASRELRWSIENTGVRSPIYKIVNSDDTPLYQISKPNPNADFWTMFYFAYAGHQIPPKRAEFGRIQKNPPEKGGGTRITITGKTEEEKRVWQTLGEGNEDCVEWVICCAVLNLLDDEILKAAELSNPNRLGPPSNTGTPIVSPRSSDAGHRPPASGPAAGSSSAIYQPPARSGQNAPAPSPRLADARPQGQQLRDGPAPSQQQQQQRPSGPSQTHSSASSMGRPGPPGRSGSHDPRMPPQQQGGPPPAQGYPRQAPPVNGHPAQPQQQQQQYAPPPGQQGRPDPRYDPRYQQQQQQQGRPMGQAPPHPHQQQQPPPSASRGRF